jgi:pyridoxal phosphate enzyme (YggS family)
MPLLNNTLLVVHQQINAAKKKYGRTEDHIQLLAVSKTQSADTIEAAFSAGQNAFGENYLQEAREKQTALSHLPIEWHFIGPIQSNKTREIAEHFSWVHSVDRIKIASRLSQQRPAHLPPLNICLQVNIDDETNKSGVALQDLEPLTRAIIQLPNVQLRGLMTIPKKTADITQQRAAFATLNHARKQLLPITPLDTLSMGMSNDMEAAIAEGATIVRVGSAIFGARTP